MPTLIAAGWSELGREGRAARLHDGELQRRQQQHPAADVRPRQPHVALRRARPLPKGHGRARWCVCNILMFSKKYCFSNANIYMELYSKEVYIYIRNSNTLSTYTLLLNNVALLGGRCSWYIYVLSPPEFDTSSVLTWKLNSLRRYISNCDTHE